MMTTLFQRLFGKQSGKAIADPATRDIGALAAPLAMPAIHVVCQQAPARSHFGGDPALPPGLAWPERDGVPLGFVARLSLTELQRVHPLPWLPASGALLFFYDLNNQPWGFDPDDRGGRAVLLVPDLAAPAEENSAVDALLPFRPVGLRPLNVLPSLERAPVVALALDEQEMERYGDNGDAVFDGLPKHQVAGYPAPVQNDNMEHECQLASRGIACGTADSDSDPRVAALRPGEAQWRLLFQVDSDDNLGVMWGDTGTLYYWVEEDKARAGNFADVWLVLQCC